MTAEDLLAPEPRKEPYSKGWGGATRSQTRKFQTKAEDDAGAILSAMKVGYLAQEPLETPFENQMGRAISYKPDYVVKDRRVFPGVIRIQGGIHSFSHVRMRRDEIQKANYETMGRWVSDLPNEEVNHRNIAHLLNEHLRPGEAHFE